MFATNNLMKGFILSRLTLYLLFFTLTFIIAQADSAEFYPSDVCTDSAGNLYIVDSNRIRRVSVDGIITTVAGTGKRGFSGDGGPAAQARLDSPQGVCIDSIGNLYIADTSNKRIRRVSVDGIITTVAGTGERGFSGDGGQATKARFSSPQGVCIDSFGNLYISDTRNYCIRRISVDGIITTIVGTGEWGFSGDGGPATKARLYSPEGVCVDSFGNLYIADTGNHCIRRVSVDGIINTVTEKPSIGTLYDVSFVNDTTGWIVGGNGTVLHTTDGGDSWRQERIENKTLYGVYFVDAQTGWAVGEDGVIIHTKDGGASWQVEGIFRFIIHPDSKETWEYISLRDVYFVNNREGWAVGSAGVTWPEEYKGIILHTTDGGDTWDEQESGTDKDLYGVHFVNPQEGWAVGGSLDAVGAFGDKTRCSGIVLHTSDGGETWELQTDNIPFLKGVNFIDAQTGWVVGGEVSTQIIHYWDVDEYVVKMMATILHTADGGRTWNSQIFDQAGLLNSVYFVSSQKGWAVGPTSVWDSWYDGWPDDFPPLSPYGGNDSRIFSTSDSGSTWTPINVTVGPPLHSVSARGQSNLWVVGGDVTILKYPLPPIPKVDCHWDVNEDGDVDISDLVIVGENFGEAPTNDKRADVNQDGVVDISDLVLVEQHFGESCKASTAAP